MYRITIRSEWENVQVNENEWISIKTIWSCSSYSLPFTLKNLKFGNEQILIRNSIFPPPLHLSSSSSTTWIGISKRPITLTLAFNQLQEHLSLLCLVSSCLAFPNTIKTRHNNGIPSVELKKSKKDGKWNGNLFFANVETRIAH